MKKNPASVSKGRTVEKFGTVPKPDGARVPRRGDDGLTCSEAQVEALLSEGEST
ncbi:MAG TPA: hypothetical protein VGA17_12450 [Nitrospiraceae bacterium]